MAIKYLPKNRANTPEQKREVLERIYQNWIKKPNCRLGQLIYVSITPTGDNFYEDLFAVEDFRLVEHINNFVNEQRMQNILK